MKKLITCKKIAASIIIPFLAVAAQGFQRGKNWRTFSSATGGFTVLLPGKPTAETEQSDSFIEHSYIVDTDWATYAVAYYEYPKILSDPETALDLLRDLLISASHGKIQNESKISLNGFPGREFSVSSLSGGLFIDTTRLYVVDNRVYMLRVIVTPAKANVSKDTNKFFSSFKLDKVNQRQVTKVRGSAVLYARRDSLSSSIISIIPASR